MLKISRPKVSKNFVVWIVSIFDKIKQFNFALFPSYTYRFHPCMFCLGFEKVQLSQFWHCNSEESFTHYSYIYLDILSWQFQKDWFQEFIWKVHDFPSFRIYFHLFLKWFHHINLIWSWNSSPLCFCVLNYRWEIVVNFPLKFSQPFHYIELH